MAQMYKVGILIVSTKGSKGEREDLVGPLLHQRLSAEGYNVAQTVIVEDDRQLIAKTLIELIDVDKLDLIITSGGTGLSPTDVTPEATADILSRPIPGLAEAMRASGRASTPFADLSRSMAGQRGESIVINLPGSPSGALEGLEVVLPSLFHALDKIKGDWSDCAI